MLKQELGSKEIRIRSKQDGETISEEVAATDRNHFCLNQSELKKLQNIGLLIEKHYKTPQDIEWAFVKGCLYLLQTRPVTTMSQDNAVEIKTKKLNKIQRWDLDNYSEHLPTPPYPLEYETMIRLQDQKNRAFNELGLHVKPANQVISMNDNGINSLLPGTPRPNLSFLLFPYNVRRLLLLNSSNSSIQEEAKLVQRLKELRELELSNLNDKQLESYIEEVMEVVEAFGRIRFLVYVFPMVLLGMWLKCLIGMARMPYEVSQFDLLGNLDYKTAIIDKALNELATLAASSVNVKKAFKELQVDKILTELRDTQEGKSFLERMDTFLEEHGSRTMKAYMPFSNLTSWLEDPSILLNALSAMLRSEEVNNYKLRIKESSEKLERLKSDINIRLPRFLRSSFLKTLDQFRNAFKGREFTLYEIEESYVALRRGVKEVTKRFVDRGYITNSGDIIYITLSELYSALKREIQPDKVKEIIIRRKGYRNNALAIWNAHKAKDNSKSGNLFKGIPSSRGTAKGPVKVINGPSEFGKLQKGDILVCTFTDPSWTPLFSLAAAVISDTGGPLSHAAIVAREYSIPAVLGTKVATSRLNDGYFVTVDGTAGVVYIENELKGIYPAHNM